MKQINTINILWSGTGLAPPQQGWLKGVNSTGATATHDMGRDGLAGSINQYVARDALGFNLNYFNGDYQAINSGVTSFPSYRQPGSSLPDNEYRPLYNGNISSMVTHLRMFDPQHVPIFYNFRYDQLNRYIRQDAYFNFNASTNTYGAWTPDSTFRERVAYDANGNIQTFARHAIGGTGALMDNLTYKYYPGTNKLRQVTDQVGDNVYGTNPQSIQDLDNQTDTSNYVYDEIGNLIQDKKEKITNVKWNVYGKIIEITRNGLAGDNVSTTRIQYTYDAQGNRISQVVEKAGSAIKEYTWYARDAQGNIITTYQASGSYSIAGLDSLTNVRLGSQMIYGISRLGAFSYGNGMDNNNTGPSTRQFYTFGSFERGWREYELTNHLGNVLTTIGDKKVGVSSGGTGSVIDYYEPFMVCATDYYPFGMVSRSFRNVNGQPDYRFGFNGKENDNDVKGFGNQQDYGMRIYDPRVGRFLSVDPLEQVYPWYTPYQFAGNMPIANIDLDGAEPKAAGKQPGEIQQGESGRSWKWDGKGWVDNSTLDAVVVTAKKKSKDDGLLKGLGVGSPQTNAMMEWAKDLKNPPKSHAERFERAVKDGASIMTRASNDPDLYNKWPYYSGQFYAATLPVLDPALVEAGFAYAFSELLGGFIGRVRIFKTTSKAPISPANMVGRNQEYFGCEFLDIPPMGPAVTLVTKTGVALPRGASIPQFLIESPFRAGAYGVYQNGKFVEVVRIDPPTPPNMKGPNFSHYHLNGGKAHLTQNWPWWDFLPKE